MKDRTLALAGVFQAAELVRQAANHGTWSGYAATCCLESLFRFEADNAADIFGGTRRMQLGVETDLTYEALSNLVNDKWAWEKGTLPNTGENLRAALAKNPYMKVFVGQGYYDLATPHFATQYMISHMNVDPMLRDNIELAYYPAGHMFYLDVESLAVFKADIDGFIKGA